MDEGERPGAEPEFLHASPRAIAKEVGDESLIAEAVAAVGTRLGANYRINAGKGRQWGRRKEFVIDSQNRRWERWERGSRGPKGGSGKTLPVLNLNWTQWKALQLAIYCAKRVSANICHFSWPCSDVSSMPTLQGVLPSPNSTEAADLQSWRAMLEHLCPALRAVGLAKRLTQGDGFDQLPKELWEKLHQGGCKEDDEWGMLQAKVQPLQEALIIELREVLIQFLIMARLDLLATELRLAIPPWGGQAQLPSPSPVRTRRANTGRGSGARQVNRYSIHDVI